MTPFLRMLQMRRTTDLVVCFVCLLAVLDGGGFIVTERDVGLAKIGRKHAGSVISGSAIILIILYNYSYIYGLPIKCIFFFIFHFFRID